MLSLVLLASCAMLHPRAAHVPQPSEIADHPAILYDRTIPTTQMTLHGIRLGDPRSAIPAWRIDHERDNWIVCDDSSRYRIENNVVAALGVWDNRILYKLNIHSPADIEARFGKPDKTESVKEIVIDHYDAGRIDVIWNSFEGQINAVNVRDSSKPE
jgi:hypothetical protein